MDTKDPTKHTPNTNARRKAPSTKPTTVYINRDLSAGEKSELATYVTQGDFTLEHVAQLATDGYSFRVGSDPRSDGFIAVLTDYVESSSTFNHALAGRGSSAINAIYACLYKHFVCFSGGWEASKATESGDFS